MRTRWSGGTITFWLDQANLAYIMSTQPSPTTHLRWQTVAAATLLPLTFILILYWGLSRPPERAFDDAFITYRYADNLRQGMGLRYNPDEWVLGTTTPLFALLLAGLGQFFPDMVTLGHGVGVISWLAAAFLAYCFFTGENRPRAALIAPLLLAFIPVLYASLGMETPLLAALMLAVACAWLRGRFWLTVGLAAALILIRQDSALWLLALGLEIWRRRSQTQAEPPKWEWQITQLPWREGLITGLLTLPWFLYALWQYGSPFPNSAAAKIGQNSLMPVTGQPPFWLGLWQTGSSGLYAVTNLFVLILLILALIGIIRQHHRFLWLIGWFLLYLLTYTWLGVVSFPWYFVPPWVVLNLLLAFSLGSLLGDDPPPTRPPATVPASFTQLRLLIIALGLLMLINRVEPMAAAQIQQGYRPAYRAIGDWLAQNSAPHESIATIEIGVVGYYSGRPILDTQGLISADMTGHQLGWAETLVYALNAHRPTYALALPDTAWDIVTAQWWFQADYAPAAQFNEATVYQRRQLTRVVYRDDTATAFAQGITVQGVDFAQQQLRPDEMITFWLKTEVATSLPADYLLTAFLIDSQTYERYAITTNEPFSGLYRSSLWQPGDQLTIPFQLTLPADLPEGTYRLGLLWYDPVAQMGLPLAGEPTETTGVGEWGWLTWGEPVAAAFPTPIPLPTPVHWQAPLTLLAAAWPLSPLSPGEMIPLQFLWQADQPLTANLTLFVHLVDDQGEIMAQQDERPGRGRWPTPGWAASQTVPHLVSIQLPESIPPGVYSLRLGWYDERGRVPLRDQSGDFFIFAQAITVQTDGR